MAVGDLPASVYVKPVAASTQARDIVFSLEHVEGGAWAATDTVSLTVVQVDLLPSDLDGELAREEGQTKEEEEDPGAWVHYNVDNDNGNLKDGDPVADYTELTEAVEGEDDLVVLTIALRPSDLPSGQVTLRRTNTGVNVWTDPQKAAANGLLVTEDEHTWDISDPAARQALAGTFHVEGVAAGTSALAADYEGHQTDLVNYNLIAALCGEQPSPSKRTWAEGNFPALVHCEWSITAPSSQYYNCIAYSAGMTDRRVAPYILVHGEYFEEWHGDGQWWISLDMKYGNSNDQYERSPDLDNFYAQELGYHPTTQDPKEAEVLYYSSFHAAVRKQCQCGVGRWLMFESKCGDAERIEHLHNQLEGAEYGTVEQGYR